MNIHVSHDKSEEHLSESALSAIQVWVEFFCIKRYGHSIVKKESADYNINLLGFVGRNVFGKPTDIVVSQVITSKKGLFLHASMSRGFDTKDMGGPLSDCAEAVFMISEKAKKKAAGNIKIDI